MADQGSFDIHDFIVVFGAPEEIRTPDPQIRSLVLYPAELRVPCRLVHFPVRAANLIKCDRNDKLCSPGFENDILQRV